MASEGTMVTNWTEIIQTFDELNLREPLLRGIYGYGFERPSSIQQRVIKPCILGRDVIAAAQSGTGKTASYIISILQRLDLEIKDFQALILAPTRELAQAIGKVVLSIGEYMGVTCHTCIGGTNIREDMKQLTAGVQVVVGTPGRVYDMFNRSVLRGESFRMLVIDESDEILSRGFKDQIDDLFPKLPNNIQMIFLSATLPNDALEMATKWMKDPVKIHHKTEELTIEGVRQYYVNVDREEWKFDTLCDLYQTVNITQTIVFCKARQAAVQLMEKMRAADFFASVVHEGMERTERETVMREFRSGASRMLITTDSLARDLDRQIMNTVINYDLPNHAQYYRNRIGWRGRFGRKGVAINFVSNEDRHMLREIEQFYGVQIPELPMDFADLF